MSEDSRARRASSNVEEIDLRELVVLLASKKKFILKWTALFSLLGLLIAFTSRTEYVSHAKLLPDSNSPGPLNLGGLGGLAGLAGINLDAGQSGVMSPDIYPQIVESLPFTIEASKIPIYFGRLDQDLPSFDYFKEVQSLSLGEFMLKYTIGLPGVVKTILVGTQEPNTSVAERGFQSFTKEDQKILESFSDRINLEYDIKTGMITLKVEMPDPYASADLTAQVTNLLMDRIVEHKVEKAKISLAFIEERYQEAKVAYEGRLGELAKFSDKNVNIVSSVAQIETQRLQNEVDVAFGVFKELATQLEQARISVKEQTPVMTVLEPPAVPTEKSKPKRLVILIVSCLTGLFFSISIVLAKFIFVSNAK